ncbi:NAD(P)-dependent oxidoreductase [Lacisediminihabitans profunda]|uniref:NAD(P)-dependent oxidoreductase n=1 Tax=Lacisediminihabitans profunda TaxID=2594790 RepID=A0A5C8UQ06_9MICO|nr:NAD(P)-dependent oxidoreductase [Lacisediminihabitans profunda]TXN29974.1 NAD(P)-dependent oxidoreductase [Lacisediminihabitans profunda]
MNGTSTVGIVGLGAMGLPMALRLAATPGVTVRGYDTAPARRRLAADGGVVAVESAAGAGDGAQLLILSVRDGVQAENALFGEAGAASALPAGAVVLLTSTIGADAARALGDRLAAAGLGLVDAPISGGPVRAGNGELLIVVGGAEHDVVAARSVLERLASTLTIVGPRVGDGQLVKVINQLLAGVHIAAAAEAVALAVGVGLDPALVVQTLSAGAASSFMLSDRGPRMVQALDGDPEVRSRVDIFVKDMALVARLAADAHIPAPVAAAAGQLYVIAERAGLGTSDDSTIVRMLAEGGQREQP